MISMMGLLEPEWITMTQGWFLNSAALLLSPADVILVEFRLYRHRK